MQTEEQRQMEKERAEYYDEQAVLQADTDRTHGFVAGKADAKSGSTGSNRTDRSWRSIAWLQGYEQAQAIFYGNGGENMTKCELKKSVYGKVRVIEGYKGISRLYVHRIKRTRSYIVTEGQPITLDSMVPIGLFGEYHFGTLKELNEHLASGW